MREFLDMAARLESGNIPSPDDIGRAIVFACKETREDPIACVQGNYGVRARHYAVHALARFWPPAFGDSAYKDWLGRAVGGRGYSFWATSLSTWTTRRWFDEAAFQRVKDAVETGLPEDEKGPVKLPDFFLSKGCVTTPIAKVQKPRPESGMDEFKTPIVLRRTPVPPELCEDQTAYYMGDPPPGRSALTEYVERQMRKAQEEADL